MDLTNDHPEQEITSVYFNNILRTDVAPLTIDQLPQDTIEDFNRQVRLAFTDEAEQTIRRVKYLIPYILQSIDWDAYGIPLEAWQLQYYYRRERFLAKSRLKYDDFMAHEPLQAAIEALGLEAEPVFEFILFLKYYYGLRADLKFSAIEQLTQACNAIEQQAEPDASIDINVGGKHFKIQNSDFVKRVLLSIDRNQLKVGRFANEFNEGSNRDKIRALDYYIIKTLLDYLPIRRDAGKKGMYSQQERNFGLSVLSFLGRLPDIDREGECSKENNATFDKLMRDFQSARIPFAMELFL